jgi:hypothetical protein
MRRMTQTNAEAHTRTYVCEVQAEEIRREEPARCLTSAVRMLTVCSRRDLAIIILQRRMIEILK